MNTIWNDIKKNYKNGTSFTRLLYVNIVLFVIYILIHVPQAISEESQITLIEIENINHYNKITGTIIPAINFLRNIVTEGIQLNMLVGKEFFIGKVKVRAHDLCRPCKHLEETLKGQDIIKEFLRRGGLRCEILNSGTIIIGDEIKVV